MGTAQGPPGRFMRFWPTARWSRSVRPPPRTTWSQISGAGAVHARCKCGHGVSPPVLRGGRRARAGAALSARRGVPQPLNPHLLPVGVAPPSHPSSSRRGQQAPGTDGDVPDVA